MKDLNIYKKLSIIIIALLFIFAFINIALTHEEHGKKGSKGDINKTEKCECCSSKTSSNSGTVIDAVGLNVSNWFNKAFLNLVDNKNYNLSLSNEALIFFLDKETVRDYVQIRNFKSWLTKEGYNNVQFVVFVNGKDSEKNQLTNLVKQNKLDMALWPTSTLVSSLGVKEYPTVYYVVNNVVIGSTNKLDQGHLKKLVGWCEHCKLTKAKDKCSMHMEQKENKGNKNHEMKGDKNIKEDKSKKKEKNCNCGSACNCGCQSGKECKCGK